jgi:hypothetical protein
MRRALYILFTSLVAVLAASATASAATIVVTNAGDGSPAFCPSQTNCTLRAAVAAAGPGDTVQLGAAPKYTIGSIFGPVMVTGQVTITGQGSAATTITQDGSSSLFYVAASGNLTLSGVQLLGAGTSIATGAAGAQGGAIDNEGTLTLDNDVLAANAAHGAQTSTMEGLGGAIYNTGQLTVENSQFEFNEALGGAVTGTQSGFGGGGGAIFTSGNATITGSSFDSGTADAGPPAGGMSGRSGSGGAIDEAEGTLTVSGSSFGATTQNSASGGQASGQGGFGGEGGAIALTGGTATLSNSASARTSLGAARRAT